MGSLNRVILIGNLGADAEFRTSQGGMTIGRFRIATSSRRKGQNGQWENETEWHRIVAFDRTVDGVREYLTKGKQVAIEGRLRTSTYEKNGEKRYSTEIVADRIQLLGGGRQSGERRYEEERPEPAREETPVAAVPQEFDDDVPF